MRWVFAGYAGRREVADPARRQARAAGPAGRGAGQRRQLVEKASDIGPAVSRALASGGPHLVDVRIDGAI